MPTHSNYLPFSFPPTHLNLILPTQPFSITIPHPFHLPFSSNLNHSQLPTPILAPYIPKHHPTTPSLSNFLPKSFPPTFSSISNPLQFPTNIHSLCLPHLYPNSLCSPSNIFSIHLSYSPFLAFSNYLLIFIQYAYLNIILPS